MVGMDCIDLIAIILLVGNIVNMLIDGNYELLMVINHGCEHSLTCVGFVYVKLKLHFCTALFCLAKFTCSSEVWRRDCHATVVWALAVHDLRCLIRNSKVDSLMVH